LYINTTCLSFTGKTKLRFVQLGIDVAEKWLKSNDPVNQFVDLWTFDSLEPIFNEFSGE
jgi:hypothetical protein